MDFRNLSEYKIEWNDCDFESSFIWIGARTWYDYSPSPDILIKVINNRKGIQQHAKDKNIIPRNLKNLFENYPNSIVLEGHYIYYYHDILLLSSYILNMLKSNEIKAIMMTVDDEVFKIKSNSKLTTIEKLDLIHEISSHTADNVHNDRRMRTLQHMLLYQWDKLEEESQKFLMTAEYYYEVAQNCKSEILDYSPAAIEYSKAIEYEIVNKIQLPFRSWVINKEGRDRIRIAMAGDLKDRELNRFASFVVNTNARPLELGTFAFINNAISKRNDKSILIDYYKKFLAQFENPQFFLSPFWLQGLKTLTTNYRNPAAHAEPLSFKKTNEFRDFLFEEKLILKFLDAL